MQSKAQDLHSDERFTPCVFSRLTDFNPSERREVFSRSMSLAELRGSILENIRLILGSRFHALARDLGESDAVMSSVLGFGLSDFCGATRSMESMARLEREVVRQIRWFEPRLAPSSVRAAVTESDEPGRPGWNILLTGRISVAPLTGDLRCFTALDLETGAITLRES